MTLRYAHSLSLLLTLLLLAVAPPVTAQSLTDYDTDDDGLIEIDSVAKLGAIRHDLNGNGDATHPDYIAAFTNRDTATATRMGCPSGTCTGYELTQNLTLTGAWSPIGGSSSTAFTATFNGDGHTIDSLNVNRSTGYGGLFGYVGGNAVLRDVGLLNVTLRSAGGTVGALAGYTHLNTTIYSCYVKGGTLEIASGGTFNVGGLFGELRGTLRASYAILDSIYMASTCGGLCNGGRSGILAGMIRKNTIIASYAAGANRHAGQSFNAGGFVGWIEHSDTRITDSYCDTSISVVSNCVGARQDASILVANTTVTGYTTTQLQNRTNYLGIYATWNIDVDGNDIIDSPWNFGTSSQYPTLNSPTQRAAMQPKSHGSVDFDANDNGLIDISTALQLNAIRWDLDGDGNPVAGNFAAYGLAFDGRDTTTAGRMGCPSGTCTGYELTTNLALTGTGNWTPTGVWNATFDGQGYTIDSLNVNTSANIDGGMFSQFGSSAVVRNLGLTNATIAQTHTPNAKSNGVLVGYMPSGGTIQSVYVSGGSISGASNNSNVGGLVGFMTSGTISASYSTATAGVSGSPTGVDVGGLVGQGNGGSITASYAAGAVSGATSGGGGGLVGRLVGSGTSITNAYCSAATGQTNCIGTTVSGISSTRYTATQMQTPTGYTGIYTHWNVDLDSDNVPDYRWNFGTSSDYPTLNTPTQRTAATPAAKDYDATDNGLIDISTAAQLNAIRWDPNGDGAPTSAGATAYSTAFGGRTHTADATTGRMGCPTSGCTGYELTADLSLSDYSNWVPLPSYTATFDGNGNAISNLTITGNTSDDAGLFAALSSTGSILRVGVTGASVSGSASGSQELGILVGLNQGVIRFSYTTGSVTSHTSGTYQKTGGLVGHLNDGGSISASYSTATVTGPTTDGTGQGTGGLVGMVGDVGNTQTGTITASYASGAVTAISTTNTGGRLGGLVGFLRQGDINQSYAYGSVTPTSGTEHVGGLVGNRFSTTTNVTDSYYDQTTSGRNDTGKGVGYLTADLQGPINYGTGIYSTWNVNVDGVSGNDDPWDFGTGTQYPALKIDFNEDGTASAYEFGVQGRSAPVPPTDYDANDNRLIEIRTPAQLNAIRWDLDGDGSSANANYATAFDNAASGMGCAAPGCNGYELMVDIDLDTDGSGTANSGDTYWNGGNGWLPADTLATNFNGNGHTISNLFISRASTPNIGLFSIIGPSGSVTNLGLPDADITGQSSTGTLAGSILGGTVTSVFSTGSVTGVDRVGGLVGAVGLGIIPSNGSIITSYSTASVTGTGTSFYIGGLVGNFPSGTIIACYATGTVTDITGGGGGLVSWAGGTITASYATAQVSGANSGGLIANDGGGTFNNNYYDSETTGQSNNIGATPKTTAELQEPTGYTGIYLNWNVDTDGQGGGDAPWDFGSPRQYPVLKVDFDNNGTATWQEFGTQRVIPVLAQVSGVQVTPGEGTLAVSWTAVTDATGYKVQWKSGDEDYDEDARQAVIAEGTTYTIENLIGGTEYTVRVIATNPDADDDGPASDAATGTPGGDGTPLPEPEPEPDTEPVFVEATDPQTYRENKAVEFTLPAAIDGEGTVTYSLTELPEGLTFDAETRIISGTPTAVTEKAIYTLTATDEDGDTGEMSFFITVVANVAPSFGDASVDAQSYMRKREIESLTLPQASGGDGTLTYALTPDLPTGLTFDAETRMLSGTPLEAMGETTYTLTATDDDGEEATLTFTLSVMADPMPTFGDTTTAIAARGYQHQAFDPVTLPQASGGDEPLTYTLTPDLPDSLTFDAETRIVSGTPVKAMDETTYTLTVTDGNGDEAHLMFTLEIPDLLPTFGGDTTIVAQSYFVNQRIESLALPQATGGDGTLAYILLPFLPDGLAFDHETRVLSGTPTEASTGATYTLSAIDADGDIASLTFSLEVSLPSPDIDGDGNVNFVDFLILADKYGSRRGQDRYDPRCDLNGDGQIDFADFLIFAADFGSTG